MNSPKSTIRVNVDSRDVGFSPNDLHMTTSAFPAVELLCLVGLQRCRPLKTNEPRMFEYYTWTGPLVPPIRVGDAAIELFVVTDRGPMRSADRRRLGRRHSQVPVMNQRSSSTPVSMFFAGKLLSASTPCLGCHRR
jgi:hypothetical protein